MSTATTQGRFQTKTVKITDPDGVDSEYTVVADLSTFKKVELHGPEDLVTVGSGFMNWMRETPRASGFYAVLIGSIPTVVEAIWSPFNQTLSVYRPGWASPMGETAMKTIIWWAPLEITNLPPETRGVKE